MENPKAMNTFLRGVVAVGLLGSLALNIYLSDVSIFLYSLGVLFLVFVGCAVSAILLGTVTWPLVWLLSRFSSRGPKRKG
jgi:hypothetical protein